MTKKQREGLATTFQCLFCNHENSVSVKLERKQGIGNLVCKVCGQSFQTSINALSAAVDVYADWIDACDAVAQEHADAGSKGVRGGYRDLDAPGRAGATAVAENEADDGFVVDDEMDGEGEYADEQ